MLLFSSLLAFLFLFIDLSKTFAIFNELKYYGNKYY